METEARRESCSQRQERKQPPGIPRFSGACGDRGGRSNVCNRGQGGCKNDVMISNPSAVRQAPGGKLFLRRLVVRQEAVIGEFAVLSRRIARRGRAEDGFIKAGNRTDDIHRYIIWIGTQTIATATKGSFSRPSMLLANDAARLLPILATSENG
jgi:hypothetical protein